MILILQEQFTIRHVTHKTGGDSQDGRLVVALSKSFHEALASLGFTPTSRSQLGVAEVKRVTALEQLIATKRAK